MSSGHRLTACPQCAAVGDESEPEVHQDAEAAPSIPDRVRALALDIAHRLRQVCAHMPDAELLELATRMARVELEYFERSAVPAPRRRATRG